MNYKKIIKYILLLVIVIPAVSFAGSVTQSLLEGKTLGESFDVVFSRIDLLDNDIDEIEENQLKILDVVEQQNRQIGELTEKNAELKIQIDKKADTPKKLFVSAECLDIKGDLNEIDKNTNLQIDKLEENKKIIWEKIQVEKESKQLNTRLVDYSKEYKEIDEQIDEVEKQAKQLKKPLIERAEIINCLLG